MHYMKPTRTPSEQLSHLLHSAMLAERAAQQEFATQGMWTPYALAQSNRAEQLRNEAATFQTQLS